MKNKSFYFSDESKKKYIWLDKEKLLLKRRKRRERYRNSENRFFDPDFEDKVLGLDKKMKIKKQVRFKDCENSIRNEKDKKFKGIEKLPRFFTRKKGILQYRIAKLKKSSAPYT